MHYPVRLSDLSIIGPAAPVPTELSGLDQSSLDDLSAALDPCPPQWEGVGFWPARSEAVLFDPMTQRLSDQVDETPDPTTKTVTARPLVVSLTPAEIAARAAAAGEALKQQVADAVQRHLDAAVAARNYSSAAAAVSYVGDPNPQWDAEGRAVLAWRSAVWTACFAALDAVLAGEREPLTPDEMVAELPPLVWPE